MGPIIISEIHYSPTEAGNGESELLEFIEIQNPQGEDELLTNWELDGGVAFRFPNGFELHAGRSVAIVSFNPATDEAAVTLFREEFGVSDDVILLGPFNGRLNDNGETIRLLRPDEPPLDEPNFVPLLLEDQARYDSLPPWPEDANAGGSSLHRSLPVNGGLDVNSWFATLPTPGDEDAGNLRVLDVSINTDQIDPDDLPIAAQPSNWNQQRSYLKSIVVVFNRRVVATPTDIRLTNLGVNAPNDENIEVPILERQFSVDGNVLTVTFELADLDDGVLELTLHDSVTDRSGNALDGDEDGLAGGAFTLTGNSQNRFYQLEVDFNGDGGVSIFDFSTFSYWFGSRVGDAPEYVDLNGDGSVTIFDFPVFAAQFGSLVTFPTDPRRSVAGNRPQQESAFVEQRVPSADLFVIEPLPLTRRRPVVAELVFEKDDTIQIDAELDERLLDDIAHQWRQGLKQFP